MIEIDGSEGEGGGQIIRTALAFSMLTQKPFHATNIRKGRSDPGLKAQHLHCIRALQKLSGALEKGAELGSTELSFYPAPLKAQSITINIGTAGSITLLLQSVLLPCLFAEKPLTLTIKGGTDTKWATPIDHFANVLIPLLQRFGKVQLTLKKRGYYPRGGGLAEIAIDPKMAHDGNFQSLLSKIKKSVEPYSLMEQGKMLSVHGMAHASSDLQKQCVAQRLAHSAKDQLLKQYPDLPLSIKKEYQDTDSTGCGIALWAPFDSGSVIGSDILGKKMVSSEGVGKEAALRLIKEVRSGAAVDCHAADQIIPFLALAKGSMRTSAITPHMLSNICAIEQFLGSIFSIEKAKKAISAS